MPLLTLVEILGLGVGVRDTGVPLAEIGFCRTVDSTVGMAIHWSACGRATGAGFRRRMWVSWVTSCYLSHWFCSCQKVCFIYLPQFNPVPVPSVTLSGRILNGVWVWFFQFLMNGPSVPLLRMRVLGAIWVDQLLDPFPCRCVLWCRVCSPSSRFPPVVLISLGSLAEKVWWTDWISFFVQRVFLQVKVCSRRLEWCDVHVEDRTMVCWVVDSSLSGSSKF